MNLAKDYFYEIYFSEEIRLEIFKNENFNAKIFFFDRVFRRHHVANDPVNWTDPSGLDRRRCARRLNSLLTPIKVGRLRHDYAQFRSSNGDVTTKSWGDKGMIDESGIDTSTRSCGDWEKSSDKADKMAQDLADTLNDIMDYGGATGYNCQDYTDNVLNFQRSR